MKLLFIVSAFRQNQLKLQPWLTVDRVGQNLIQQGHEVHVITDGRPGEVAGLKVHPVVSLRNRERNRIESLIRKIQPDKIIVCISPLSLVTASWYQLFKQYDAYGFMSNAFYTFGEYLKAAPYLGATDLLGFGKQIIVPERVWASKIKMLFKGVICQSVNTEERMQKALGKDFPIFFIPPGIDLEQWRMKTDVSEETEDVCFLYAGSLKKIRGYHILLKAYARVQQSGTQLMILARGADENELKKIDHQISALGIRERVCVIGGWIDDEQFKNYIQNAAAVLLPFILVPSELPVTVMESIACGTPVMVSKIDGLPGAAGDAGYVIPHADSKALASAINRLASDRELVCRLSEQCRKVRGNMLSWETVAQKWKKVLA